MTTAVTKRDERETLEAILKRPAYAERFKQVLGEKASQFCSSLVAIGRTMPDVEPKSIVGSAMIAACLDLPIEKSLGFAWIVPYSTDGKKYAQFQIGFRGYIQLAQRTGYYAGMNACTINEEAYKGRDHLGEPIIDWNLVDETKPAVGYFFGFKMINGFMKGTYWTKAKVEAHARRYSQAFRSNRDTPWKSHFDKMALKTVISNELSDWGIMSVQFQLARQTDQGITKDIDTETEFIDNTEAEQLEDRKPEPTKLQQAKDDKKKEEKPPTKPQDAPPHATTPPTAQTTPTEPPKNAEQAQNASGEIFEPAQPANSAQSDEKEEAAAGLAPVTPTVTEPATPFVPNHAESPALQNVRYLLHKHGKTEDQLLPVLLEKKLRKENQRLEHLAEGKLVNIGKVWGTFLEAMK